MPEIDLKGKRVTVLGLGSHRGGEGAVRFLVGQGAKVIVSDLKDEKALADTLLRIGDLPVELSLGGHNPEVLETDLLVRNPAVPNNSPVLEEAERRGIPVVMETSLFFEFCPSAKVIGITGTKGKTTAALILEKVLRGAGEDVVAAGNFGRSMLEVLPSIGAETWVVLELSSFQLEGLPAVRRSPHIAAVTNLFPDHLNRYRGMDEYAEAKRNIFKYQRSGDMFFLERGLEKVWDLPESSSSVVYFEGGGKELVETIANRLGFAFDSTLLEMSVPFRQEPVGEKQGVRFINDGCATNPGATLYALDKFDERVVLITGGTDKNLDYGALVAEIDRRRTPVVLLSGSATEKIKAGLRKELILAETRDLGEAVRTAYSFALAKEGACPSNPGRQRGVLFSPAAASFELFRDEFDRGEQFNEAVRAL